MVTRLVTKFAVNGILALALSMPWLPVRAAAAVAIVVYKDPQCGCCVKWADHLSRNGFQVTTRNMAAMNMVKAAQGVPVPLASCHTAIVDGYVVEGHVPAAAIQRLLRERPRIKGIAVPGMPAGSPGMEGPRASRYDILSFDAAGKTAVYESR
jgi:hypothetical protein